MENSFLLTDINDFNLFTFIQENSLFVEQSIFLLLFALFFQIELLLR